ncbi:MAG: methionyl-tRNA formyltransferase [Candidatus Paceibacterota bacterium]
MENLKIIFLGNPEFALPSLEALIKENYQIAGVITSPDRPTGRKQILTPPPVKVLAQKNNLPVYQPKDKNELLEIVKKLEPDLAAVVAYGMIFPKEVLDIPKYGFVNVHPSLLPKYRGATPIQAAILNGDEKTGVSLFKIDKKMDHGPIVATRQLEFSIFNYQFSKLSDELANLGANLLIETLPKYVSGEITPLAQDDSLATYTKKIKTEDAFIDLEKDNPVEMERKIRALNPEPGTWTMEDNKRVKILEAVLIDGKLKITKIQVEGGKPQNVCRIV